MKKRTVWLTGLLFALVHVAVSIALVLIAAVESSEAEWGMAIAASLTTFPLAGVYDRLLDRAGMPALIQFGLPIFIGAFIYGTLGATVGCGIERIVRYKSNRLRNHA